ncbi:type II secretion system protein [Rubellicoccus peritrichatus]|uniref:Type II secretion system protein n=1 Tax=Rubellicoccus peritrichatus TaxID=3080537 RepID=A0AAQ3LDC9_9BACT|nr:type II secretion system protein [Puniceicoccus sp. CR14]WOO43406.1 type II secretion system protein [Puniceicoccus sp. CR14]
MHQSTFNSNNDHKRSGFTLTELLVVIAIIGVLSAILIPTIGSVREKSNTTEGVATMRQIGTTSLIYAQDNRGRLPGPSWWGVHATASTGLPKALYPYYHGVEVPASEKGKILEPFVPNFLRELCEENPGQTLYIITSDNIEGSSTENAWRGEGGKPQASPWGYLKYNEMPLTLEAIAAQAADRPKSRRGLPSVELMRNAAVFDESLSYSDWMASPYGGNYLALMADGHVQVRDGGGVAKTNWAK